MQGLRVSPDEGAALGRAFSRKKYDDFRAKGILVGGKKYIFLRTDDDDRIVVARCKDETLTMQKTKTGIELYNAGSFLKWKYSHIYSLSKNKTNWVSDIWIHAETKLIRRLQN